VERQTRAVDLVGAAEPGKFRRGPGTGTSLASMTCRRGRMTGLSEDCFNISPWTYPTSNSLKASSQTNRDTAAKAVRTKTNVRRNFLFIAGYANQEFTKMRQQARLRGLVFFGAAGDSSSPDDGVGFHGRGGYGSPFKTCTVAGLTEDGSSRSLT
jgi:hypothetical protein